MIIPCRRHNSSILFWQNHVTAAGIRSKEVNLARKSPQERVNLARHFDPGELVADHDFARRSGDPLLFQVVGSSEPG